MNKQLVALVLSLVILGVSAATSVATPTISPTPTEKEPLHFTLETKRLFRLSPFVTIECTVGKSEGTLTSADSGKLTLTVEGCLTKSFFTKPVLCKLASKTNGTMVFTLEASVVAMLVKKELSLGLLLQLPEPVFIECSIIKTELSGGAVGKLDGIKSGAKVSAGTLNFNLKEGLQELTQCEFLEAVCLETKGGKPKLFLLLERISGEEPFNRAAMELTEDKVEFGKTVEITY